MITLEDFLAELNNIEATISINLAAGIKLKENTAGTKFYLMTTSDGEEVAVHEESLAAFKSAITKDGKLPQNWRISKSGMLYPRQDKATGKPWER